MDADTENSLKREIIDAIWRWEAGAEEKDYEDLALDIIALVKRHAGEKQ